MSSFAGALAAAYFIYPPYNSILVDDPRHIAELGFFLLLAITGSKAVAVLKEGPAKAAPKSRHPWHIHQRSSSPSMTVTAVKAPSGRSPRLAFAPAAALSLLLFGGTGLGGLEIGFGAAHQHPNPPHPLGDCCARAARATQPPRRRAA